jgi:hypothetical protein
MKPCFTGMCGKLCSTRIGERVGAFVKLNSTQEPHSLFRVHSMSPTTNKQQTNRGPFDHNVIH